MQGHEHGKGKSKPETGLWSLGQGSWIRAQNGEGRAGSRCEVLKMGTKVCGRVGYVVEHLEWAWVMGTCGSELQCYTECNNILPHSPQLFCHYFASPFVSHIYRHSLQTLNTCVCINSAQLAGNQQEFFLSLVLCIFLATCHFLNISSRNLNFSDHFTYSLRVLCLFLEPKLAKGYNLRFIFYWAYSHIPSLAHHQTQTIYFRPVNYLNLFKPKSFWSHLLTLQSVSTILGQTITSIFYPNSTPHRFRTKQGNTFLNKNHYWCSRSIGRLNTRLWRPIALYVPMRMSRSLTKWASWLTRRNSRRFILILNSSPVLKPVSSWPKHRLLRKSSLTEKWERGSVCWNDVIMLHSRLSMPHLAHTSARTISRTLQQHLHWTTPESSQHQNHPNPLSMH